jgi:hypothetical protein
MAGNPQTYNTLQTMLLAALVRGQPPWTVPPDAFFATLYPQAITYAEGRIYKDLVLLATREIDTSLTTTAGQRTINISTTNLIVIEGFALVTPAGSPNGTRVPFDMSTLDVISEIWPNASVTVPPDVNDFSPRFWAMLNASSVVYCPTADDSYTVALTGLFQPTALSNSNQSTYLSTVYPELLEAACMVFLTGALLHNFSAQSDNPQRAISWEGIYDQLADLAWSEERRRRGLDPDIARPRHAAPPPGAPA